MPALLALFLALSLPARAVVLPAATIEAEIDGQTVHLPQLKTDAAVHISGDLASVQLVQTFANPGDATLHATYLFPLPENAAVHAMRLVAGELEIEAQIKRREEAAQVFEQAKQEGHQAALLQQHRPNVFTQDIANLPPGAEVRVEIEYAHAIPKNDGAFDFQLPLVVGPRYVPPTRLHTGEPEPLDIGVWSVDQLSAKPAQIDPDRVSIQVRLDAGGPIASVDSPTHAVQAMGQGSTRDLHLAEGRTIDNRDFVLRYRLADDAVAARATTWADGGRGYVSLLIDPPAAAADADLTRREMVFVLDTSGSMSGAPMEASKAFMRAALETLRPTDSFRIVRFSRWATQLHDGPLEATRDNLRRAAVYIDGLSAGGGTEMRSGINAALGPEQVAGTVRIVVFLTDGYIGNDADAIRLVAQKRKDARLFSLGIGTSVNRYLLEELARAGRGVARIVTDLEEAPDAARTLAERLAAPYLTDVRIDWGAAPVRDVSPRILPDLYLGQPLRVTGRYAGSGSFPVVVHGKIAGADARLPLRVYLPTHAAGADALPIAWARAQIEDRMVDYLDPNNERDERDRLREEVTILGLEHRLVTRWTSFVAVAPTPDPVVGQPRVAQVPTPTPAGVAPSSGATWGGNAAPEPAGWLALATLLGLGGAARRRRQSAAK